MSSIFIKPFQIIRNIFSCSSSSSYQIFDSTNPMAKLKNTILCISIIIISFVLISCYYLSDSDYRRKLTEINKFKQYRIKRPQQCDYQACPPIKPGYLNVHIIPHSHDDMGWLKTVDEYYTGEGDPNVPFSVRKIITTAIESLQKDPNRRYIQVETGFFSKWWKEQNETNKAIVKNLVNTGRLEFTGGAWAMNDEAVTHYTSIIDGFTLGLRLLNETFGECGRPRIGWHIDPFGHSREMASLLAHMGYDAFLFARIDYQDHKTRQDNKKLQMLWEASPNLGKASHIFTEMTNGLYNPPDGFCFDILCHTEFEDSAESGYSNAKYKSEDLLEYIQQQAEMYRSPNVPIMFGGDFTYQNAEYYFKSLDKLIRYINNLQKNGSMVNLLYSTPGCYVNAVHEAGIPLPTKRDDFFPYGSNKYSFWTGYYTSRPNLKHYERFGHNFLQISKQLYILSNLRSDTSHDHEVDLNELREAMGVLQHHDAITGTAKQHVTNDYAFLLYKGIQAGMKVCNAAFKNLMKYSPEEQTEAFKSPIQSCLYLNISSCAFTESKEKFVINVYNSLSESVDKYIRFTIHSNRDYKVQDYKGNTLPTQIVPIHAKVIELSERTVEKSSATFELIFKATLPAVGFASYFVTTSQRSKVQYVDSSNSKFIGSVNFGLRLNEENGVIQGIMKDNVTLEMEQDFVYYIAHELDPELDGDVASGAYIFNPENKPSGQVSLSSGNVVSTVYRGPLVEEIHQTFTKSNKSFVSQVIRLYKGEKHFEFEWLVGPIPVEDGTGKEVVSRYTIASIDSKNTFYTDSNGREMIERIRDYRTTFDLLNVENVSSNYYPVTSRIMIQDDVLQMSVLTDRAQGGSSLKKGQIELMLHRRLIHDDGKGVEEPLNEPGFDGKGLIVRGKHWFTLGKKIDQTAKDRNLCSRMIHHPWTFFVPIDNNLSFEAWQSKFNMMYSGINKILPEGLKILSLEPWSDKRILLRIEHTLENNDDEELSKPATINLYKFFQPFRIETIYETTLSGTQWFKDMKRMKWNKTDTDFHNHFDSNIESTVDRSFTDVYNITLTPMMIRTFVLTVGYH